MIAELKKSIILEKLQEYYYELTKGLVKMNPTFVYVLGMCPTLAVTTTIDNAIGMGLSTTFVMIFAGIFISAIRKIVPNNVRIPVFITIIATFVVIVGLLLKAFTPALDKSLGIYIPLIVVNCILLERAESFASKNGIFKSILDAIGMGLGFTLSITLISVFRELLGTGKVAFFGQELISITSFYHPLLSFILAPGALLTLGLLFAFFQWKSNSNIQKKACLCSECDTINCPVRVSE